MDVLFPSSPRPLDPLSVEGILHHTSLLDIMRLIRTCSAWRFECLRYIRSKQVSLLRTYFSDHTGMLSLLRLTASVLSGVKVLDFALHGTLLPPLYAPSLEIHADCLHAAAVVHHLRYVEGYHVCPPNADFDEPLLELRLDAIVDIVYLAHPHKQKRVDVVCGSRVSSIFTVAHASCTLDMNYLSADRLVVGYPALTMRGINIESPMHDDPGGRRRQMYFYQRRGFRTGPLDWRTVSFTLLYFYYSLTVFSGALQLCFRWVLWRLHMPLNAFVVGPSLHPPIVDFVFF